MSTHAITEDLSAALRAGQEAALRDLIRTYSKPLVYFADNLIRNSEVAEEIVQDGFVKLWNRHAEFHSASKIKAFLYIVTKNACFNYLKTAKYRYTEEVEDWTDRLANPDPDLLTAIIHAELMTEIYQELEKLPEQYRRIFRMSYLEDKTTEEICAELGVSPNAVFTGKSKAIGLLRKAFKGKNLVLYLSFLQWLGGGE